MRTSSPEPAIRQVALGAQSRDVMTLVMRDGIKPVSTGAAAGLVGALAAMRQISAMLHGVTT